MTSASGNSMSSPICCLLIGWSKFNRYVQTAASQQSTALATRNPARSSPSDNPPPPEKRSTTVTPFAITHPIPIELASPSNICSASRAGPSLDCITTSHARSLPSSKDPPRTKRNSTAVGGLRKRTERIVGVNRSIRTRISTLFRIHRETGAVDQWLAPEDIESLVKIARVLAFELAEVGCMDRLLRERLYQLAECLDELIERDS